MSDNSVRNYRSRLFRTLRVFFFLNFAFSVIVLGFAFYQRKRVTALESSVKFLSKSNVALYYSYEKAVHTLTNDYFNFASSFVSNVVVFSCSNSIPFSSSVISGSSSSNKEDLPSFDFQGYFQVDGFPYVTLRNTHFKKGDFILGYPIEDISPDFVQYRGRFYKIRDVRNEKSYDILRDGN